jgi:hypothetical protein
MSIFLDESEIKQDVDAAISSISQLLARVRSRAAA